jgi:hypothetical protein
MSGERRIRFIGSVTAYACCSASRINLTRESDAGNVRLLRGCAADNRRHYLSHVAARSHRTWNWRPRPAPARSWLTVSESAEQSAILLCEGLVKERGGRAAVLAERFENARKNARPRYGLALSRPPGLS